MKVVARLNDQNQLKLTAKKEYEVYCISMWRGIIYFCVINDTNMTLWTESKKFIVSDHSVKKDWIFTEIKGEEGEGEVSFVLGPEFIAKNGASYNAFVDLESDQIYTFLKYIDKRN